MTDCHPSEALQAYAEQVLAGTGLSIADVTGGADCAEGSAAHALKLGWEAASRAAKVQGA